MAKTSNRSISPSPKAVFLVEDHPVFRQGLVQLLTSEKDLTVCGEAPNAEEALKAIPRLKPDLVLVDITLPGKDGLELIKELRARDRKVKLLVISMHDEALYANRVLRAGGDGYIMKQEDPEELLRAVRDVLNGHIYVSEHVMAKLPKPASGSSRKGRAGRLDKFTDLQLQILEFLGRGKSNREIARQLRLSLAAVTRHCARMRLGLKLRNTNALIREAVCWVEGGRA